MNFPFDLINHVSISVDSITHLIFFLVSGFVAVISAIFLFHWHRYMLGNKLILTITEFIYIGVCVILLTVAFFSIN
jgi:hypothetical protein